MITFLITRPSLTTSVGGFENTYWDLVSNTVGASRAAVLVRREWSGDAADVALDADRAAIA